MKLNKIGDTLFAISCILISSFCLLGGCDTPIIKHDKIDSLVFNLKDTISDSLINKYDADARYFETSRELNLAKDSIQILNKELEDFKIKANNAYINLLASRDSAIRMNVITIEKLGTAEYKLLRIREYNRIAAQGNNIKFLRGWINRVITK